ncbi:MAG: ABC transporter permease subunit [Proteobacteria bacterium]|nr:ABC transporter permease subunit [Pseudomonadota bacterium]
MSDLFVLIMLFAMISLVFFLGQEWKGDLKSVASISLEYKNLPYYVIQSVSRIGIAYILSLCFSIGYGYLAKKNRITETVLISLLDILQSIPVLSFLPGVLLAMISLFPNKRIGVELASIILIFTGQVWNMAFSYYNSISTIPRDILEVARIHRFSKFYRFIKIDLPFSAIGLVWNSMMSVAGGWFFLMACEMFVIKDKDFRLPGIGSFIQMAANEGDLQKVMVGLIVMVAIIVLLDILIWRPLVVWSQKFRFDTVQSEDEKESIVLNILRDSKILDKIWDSIESKIDKINNYLVNRQIRNIQVKKGVFKKLLIGIFFAFLFLLLFKGVITTINMLSEITFNDIFLLLKAGFLSLLRTLGAITIAAIWTVPLGVIIGMKPRVANVLQPIIQIAASIPATALFPIIIYFLLKIGGGLGFGSVFLMLLGTQWYLLFNVIAGASSIPQDLKDIAELYKIKGLRKWKILILPGIFPYLVTGLITATGGAWNASIVSEYVVFGGEVQKTLGLGSLISESSASGNFSLLFASTLLMSIIVVTLNRFVWKRMFLLAQEKFRLD